MPKSTRSRADKKVGSREEGLENQEAETMALDAEDFADPDRPRTLRNPPVVNTLWWQRSRTEIQQQPPHQCFSFTLVPCMIVVTVILIVLASKYKHLEEPAEIALNATLEVIKSKIR